jgi:hypothetical protein
MLRDAQDGAEQKARAALQASPVFALQHLTVDAAEQRLILSGKVNCFYHKQLAQEIVRHAVEGIRVTNTISVEEERTRADLVDKPSLVG